MSDMPKPTPKRPRLTFSLRTFLVVTLLLSVVLGYFGRAWWKAYRDSQPPHAARVGADREAARDPHAAAAPLVPPGW